MTDIEKAFMKSQQKILGWLCLLMPFLCLGFGLIGNAYNMQPNEWACTISISYYCTHKIILIGILSAVSVFFFAYKGYDLFERILTDITGLFALCIILFPMESGGFVDPNHVGFFCLPEKVSHILHCASALIFYATYGLMLLRFRFTSNKETMTEKKKIRNTIYLWCVIIGTFVGGTLSLLGNLPMFPKLLVIIGEITLNTCVSLGWMVKAECIKLLND